jgi:hypothetical protein
MMENPNSQDQYSLNSGTPPNNVQAKKSLAMEAEMKQNMIVL